MKRKSFAILKTDLFTRIYDSFFFYYILYNIAQIFINCLSDSIYRVELKSINIGFDIRITDLFLFK